MDEENDVKTGKDARPTLTLRLNNREYELSHEFLDYIEACTEASFDRNEYCEMWWTEYDRAFKEDYPNADITASLGDPILIIETEGHMKPWNEIIQPQSEDASTDQKLEDVDNQQEEERLPEMPEGQPEVPTYAQSIPEQDGDVWGATDAIIPTVDFYFRNLQYKVDNPTYTEQSDPKSTSHNKWEHVAEALDCEMIEDSVEETDEEKRKSWSYEQKDGDNAGTGKVGDRWSL